MSYISRAQDPGRRTTAIAAVVLVHAALGYALVTGLTYHVIEKVREYRPTFDFRDPPLEAFCAWRIKALQGMRPGTPP